MNDPIATSLTLVTGKGGVGKSTVVAGLGRLLASRGQRTLLVEIDPRESLAPLLDVDPSDGETVQVNPSLDLLNVQPSEVLAELVRERVKLGWVAKKLTASSVYDHFVSGAPGLKELAVLGHAYSQIKEGHYDRVVIDAPATGHALSLLRAPGSVTEVLADGPVADLAQELHTFVSDTSRCGVALVCLAEEMPVSETLELCDAIQKELQREPLWIVMNQLLPLAQEADGPVREAAWFQDWRRRSATQVKERARLDAATTCPLWDLPLEPAPSPSALSDALSAHLTRQAKGGA